MREAGLLLCGLLLGSCLLPADERAELDGRVGRAEADGMSVEVADGLAAVRAFDGERLVLWAQAPALRIALRLSAQRERTLAIDVLNCSAGARLLTPNDELASQPLADRRASCSFMLTVDGDVELRLEPPGAASEEPFAFAVLSDVQSAIGSVHEIFERMNQDPELRFVVSTGDLVDTGERPELTRFQRELRPLAIPFFSTVGNHEMGAPTEVWHELFGLFSAHFGFRGVSFSLVDSGNATIDPHVYDKLDGWLTDARSAPHVVLTHVPPLDPVGLRGGGFRSRKEAGKLLQKLATGRVDALFLGHIHSYYAFSAAGVPTYISGGGGAIPEQLDGIARHYLRVRVDPTRGIQEVAVVRID